MSNETVARRYAAAIFALASEQHVIDAIATELHTTLSLIDGNADLAAFLTSPVVKREAKSSALLAAFEGRVHIITLHTLLLLVQKRRTAIFAGIVRAYDELVRASRNRQSLTITSARPLAHAELESLVQRLGSVYASSFDVKQDLDPRLIGGVRVQMDDRRLDGTISARIEDLAATLFSQS